METIPNYVYNFGEFITASLLIILFLAFIFLVYYRHKNK